MFGSLSGPVGADEGCHPLIQGLLRRLDCQWRKVEAPVAGMASDHVRHGVPEARAAWVRVQRWGESKGLHVPEKEDESLREYRIRLLAALEELELDDHLQQLDVEVARAYVRHVLIPDEPPMVEPTGEMHKQELVPELGFNVDRGMVPLIKALWLREYRTISSCEEAYYVGNWAEVTFDRPADAQRMIFVCATAGEVWEDAGFFGRVTGSPLKGPRYDGPRWGLSARIAGTDAFSSGVPGLHPFMVTLSLPPSDIPIAARAIEEFSGRRTERVEWWGPPGRH